MTPERVRVRLSDHHHGHVDKDPNVTVDCKGRTWVVWHAYRPREDRILVRSFKGQRRGPLLEVSEAAGLNFQPRIACTGSDVWVVWCAKRSGKWCVLARCVSKMGKVVELADSDENLAFPGIATDVQGQVWVAWTGLVDGGRKIFGRYLEGRKWSECIELSQGVGDHYRPVLCGHQDGVWIAYQTFRKGAYDLFLRNWTPDNLGRPGKFSLTDDWEMFPRLCSDGENGVWATWVVTHDVIHPKGFVDHKVEIMASRFDGKHWEPYRSPDRTKPDGYVAHLYEGLLGRKHYMGFVGWRRRPQVVREEGGDVWVLYERKEDEMVNRHGPDALFYARPLTGRGQGRSYEVDQEVHAYTVNGDLPVMDGELTFAAQISEGRFYADICARIIPLDRSRPVKERPASNWKAWQSFQLPRPRDFDRRPTMQVDGKTYKLYWGDPHCHGNLSGDAEGEIDENYAFGRYKSRLDFMAVTDNDVIYDNILTPSELDFIVAEAEHFNEPGKFVAIPAYERTYRKERKKGPNHRILLFPKGPLPLYHFTEPDADTLEKWAALMDKTEVFGFPHHSTWWTIPGERIGGVELCSCWDIYIQMADTIPEALRQGIKLAFMGNSDSHRIVPGMGGALTGVWAEELTREAILEALWARRCFATNGSRLVLDVRTNGAPMGSVVQAKGSVKVTCKLQAPRVVERITLFRDGEKVKEQRIGKKKVSMVFEDGPENGEHFYYVEVALRSLRRIPMGGRCGNLQVAQGDFAWSSPIWVNGI